MRIALLEDDPHQAEVMELWLATAQHACKSFASGASFIEALRKESFDLLIIDWVLPDIPGDKVLDWVRENLGWKIPVLFVTVCDREEDVVKIIKQGADDYMIKPVKHLEMLVRIEALGRRSDASRQVSGNARYGCFEVDLKARRILRSGVEVELTQKEFELAAYMLANNGRLLSRDELLDRIWGVNADVDTRTVDTHVSRIRKKLQLVPENGWRLTPIYGYGYRLEKVDLAGGQATGLAEWQI